MGLVMFSDRIELYSPGRLPGHVTVKNLVQNAWIRLLIVDPESGEVWLFEDGVWQNSALPSAEPVTAQESFPL